MENISSNTIHNIAIDRRLSSLDVRILMYFISLQIDKNNKEEYNKSVRQEYISDILNVTRENLNRSITKLKNLGYLDIDNRDTRGNYYDKLVLNIDTNEREVLNRKIRVQDSTYIINDYARTKFSIFELMELMNIDVKDSKKKLLTEDNYRSKGKIYQNLKTGKLKELLSDEEKKSDDWIELTKVEVLERNHFSAVDDLITNFERKYNKKIYSIEGLEKYLNIEGLILLVANCDLYKEDIDIRVYDAIKNFRDKFLDNTIFYYIKRNILKEDFLIEYNVFSRKYIENRIISKDYIMKILGFKNRDTAQVKAKFNKLFDNIGMSADNQYTFREVLNIFVELENTIPDIDFSQHDGLFNLNFSEFKEIYKL